MTDKRFLIQEADSGRKIEMSIADTSKVNFTLKDFREFWNYGEKGSPYYEYIGYLWSNKAFLTVDEADELLNNLADENMELKKENKKLKAHVNDTEIAVEIETEKCMQRVFDVIDKHTEYWSQKYDLAGVDTLLKLKKELKE